MDALRSLTRDEAADRADAIEVLRYDIEVDFTGMAEGPDFAAVSTIRFRTLGGATDTFVDCAAEVRSARLNGADIDVADIADSRIALHDLAAENVLVVESVQSRTNESTGIHRSVDLADKQVYVWTSFEPDEARRAWACFDQPDLKAPHAFSVLAPDTWTVLSNTGHAEVTEERGGAPVALRRDAAAVDVRRRRQRRTLLRAAGRARRIPAGALQPPVTGSDPRPRRRRALRPDRCRAGVVR